MTSHLADEHILWSLCADVFANDKKTGELLDRWMQDIGDPDNFCCDSCYVIHRNPDPDLNRVTELVSLYFSTQSALTTRE